MDVKIVLILWAISFAHALTGGDTEVQSPIDSNHQNIPKNHEEIPKNHQNISKKCFDCICQASSGCDLNVQCNNGVCGPFSITYSYWAHAGKLTINHEDPDSVTAYVHCVNDLTCATKVVHRYMNRFAQDCNGDGVINCEDYARIHNLGGFGCNGTADHTYIETYRSCKHPAKRQKS